MTRPAGGRPGPRALAYQTLCRMERDGVYVNLAMKDMLAGAVGQNAADRALATTLVYGVVKYKLGLDYLISRFSSVKLKKLSLPVKTILRMGVYQLRYLDRIPASAAVNESVKLAEAYAYRSKGFVNGVLRAALRGMDSVAYPAPLAERLSVQYSFPTEIVTMWLKELGEERCEALLSELNRPPLLTVRMNSLLATEEQICAILREEGFAVEAGPVEDSLLISGGNIAASAAFERGLVTPQGLGSMLSVQALAPEPGMLAMDLCAAPGGKSTYIAQRMRGRGRVIAFDIHAHRVELIKRNAARMGLGIIEAEERDSLLVDGAYAGRADRVLVDAPCSGLGVIHKKPDIKWSFAAQKTDELAKLQLGLLCAGAAYVRPGGALVYSTCTISEQENEQVCAWFLSQHPEFEAVDLGVELPQGALRGAGVQLLPDGSGMDGFYICKMKRRE